MKKSTHQGFLPLFFLCLVQFGTMADDSAFANSLTAIAINLHATVAQMQFANMIYPLIAGSIMVAAGLLGNRIGLKRLMLLGLVIMAVAEAIIWVSPTINVLVYGGRVLAGIGGSLCVPGLLGLATDLYAGNRRAIAYGCIGATTAVGSSLAPVLSGLIIVYLNWRVSFLILSLLFVAGLVGIQLTVKGSLPKKTKIPFDTAGFVLLAAGFTLFMFGMAHISSWGFMTVDSAPFTLLGLPPVPFIMTAGWIFLGLFLKHEKRLEKQKGQDAVLLPSLFLTNAAIRGGIMMSAYVFYILGGVIFSIVIFMQVVLANSPIMSGLYISIFSLGMSITSILTSSLAANFSPRQLCQVGIIVTSLSTLIVMMGLQENSVNLLFFLGLFIVGLGVGVVASQCNLAVASAIKDANLANKSSGIQGAARNIGESAGIAIIGIMIMVGLTASIKNHVQDVEIIPASIQAQVRLSHKIPFMSNAEMRHYLETQKVDNEIAETLTKINDEGRLHAMRVTLLMMCLSGFLFILVTPGIVSRKLKDLSTSSAAM